MGSMSASDAAPLPRLGEVFFDVRGNSRSMRLSWYADTGVAVLSIWQGGMCTGTFRLAIADLPRMVQTLQRGPGGQRPEWDAETQAAAPAAEPEAGMARVRAMPPLPSEDLLAESEGPRTGAAEYLADPANDPRSAATQYLAPPRDYPAGPPDQRAHAPGYRAGRPGDVPPSSPPDYLGASPGDRVPSPEYLAGPPGHRADSSPGYLAGPAEHRAPASPDYLADAPASPDSPPRPPGHRAGPPEHRPPASPDYLAGPPEHRPPASPDYPPRPPGHRADPLGYASAPPAYPADRPDVAADPPGNYLTGPANFREDPPGYQPEHRADLPGQSAIGPDALRPGGPGAWNPGADRSSYPRDPRSPADYPEGPYPGGPGQPEYRGESAVPHYQPGSAASGDGDAHGRSTADYPAHYASTVTDDDPLGPSQDSFPYGSPPRGRRAASRHAAPDEPFD
jgi:hypothetical protein